HGLREHGRGVTHGTAGMRAAADLHHVGVAEDDVDALDRHVDEVGDDLGEARLVALAARLGADHHVDAALRTYADACLLVGRADRGLHVVGEAAAEQPAALAGLALALSKAVPVGDRHRPLHVVLVAAAVVIHADRVAVGHRLRPNQVAAPELHAIDAEL